MPGGTTLLRNLREVRSNTRAVKENRYSRRGCWPCNRHFRIAYRVDMQSGSDGYTASIPGDYTDSPYPLEYYFELRGGSEAAWFHPAFNSTFSNQPYYALDKRES